MFRSLFIPPFSFTSIYRWNEKKRRKKKEKSLFFEPRVVVMALKVYIVALLCMCLRLTLVLCVTSYVTGVVNERSLRFAFRIEREEPERRAATME